MSEKQVAMAMQEVEGHAQARMGLPRAGSVGLVLLVAFALVGAAVGLLMAGRGRADSYILFLLATLSVVGVFALFAGAAGILRLAGGESEDALPTAVTEGMSDGLLVTDAAGRVLYANPAYRRLTDAAGSDDVRPVERVFVGDPDMSEAIYRLSKAASEGRPLQEEVRVTDLRGQGARWLRLRVRPLAETGRFARATVWTVADITRDRVRQENVFQELQHAIDYLDHAPAGFFSVDPAGRIVYLNATLAGWLDHDLAQVGSGELELGDIVAGDGAALLTGIGGAPGEVKTEVLDLDLKTRSGRTLPVRLFHKRAFAADGSPGASRTLVINRARNDGDPQRAADVRFMRFFHNAPMAIATVARGGRIVQANAPFARMHQTLIKRDGSLEGGSILSAVAERDRPALESAIAEAAEKPGQIAAVDVALAGEGSRFARLFVAGIDDEEGVGEAAIVYAVETTQQKALEAQVNQSQKMDSVGQLAGGIAHDFNNVLSAIMMATDFLLNAHRPTDPSFQDIMQIKQNANRAASLVRQLLAFSRRQTMRPQVLDLGEVLSDLTMLLRRLIGEKVALEVSHGRDLWPVLVDLSQFEQVIVNLAVNARDAMPDGGKLTVRTANVPAAECARYAYRGLPAADFVLIEIGDTGTGIPPEIIDKIFEPFFSTKEVGKGTGLGLSTVYGIIKQTGGFIFLDSQVGVGTTFRIFLPRHVGEAPQADTPAQPARAGTPERPAADLTGRGTILLVEDEAGLRGLNARGLASRGYTVLEAANGIEAIELLKAQRGEIDLVVSDVVMPEMDGPTLLKEMRKINPELKMVFVSGYAEDAFEKNLPEGGQFTFLAKPFTLKQLVAVVKETIGQPAPPAS